ncbi:hypothetical protein Syun_001908 [Stephania yunnanensis]|uniref:Uncharacterized protein n=1 Tax=Stephania yunnanensis TaxID=152371 RepID=A0AAP0LEM7_9MAGN
MEQLKVEEVQASLLGRGRRTCALWLPLEVVAVQTLIVCSSRKGRYNLYVFI